MGLRGAGEVPLALAGERKRPSTMLGNPAPNEVRPEREHAFALLESNRAKAATNPRVEVSKYAAVICKSEIIPPSTKAGVIHDSN